jgi:hypothetical protein
MIGNVAALITYAGARGTVIADTAATLQALVRASDYIQFTYLDGSRCTVDSANVVEATYEAAIAEAAAPGIWTKTFTPADQKVIIGVGDIKWQVTGDASKGGASIPRSTKIETMLRQCISGGLYGYSTGPRLV